MAANKRLSIFHLLKNVLSGYKNRNNQKTTLGCGVLVSTNNDGGKRVSEKLQFANTMAELDLGITAASVMTDCEKYGMVGGCDEDCPVLIRGECELQEADNKELYLRIVDFNL